MAKSKVKKPPGNTLGAPSKKPTDRQSSKTSLPTFDETALSKLTQKIETQLSNPAGNKQGDNSRKNESDGGNSRRVNDIAPNASKVNAAPSKKGKKRARNGDVLTAEKEGKMTAPTKPVEKELDKDLEREILALGGTNEDLELIAGVESGSEMDEKSASHIKSKGSVDEKSLQKSINEIIKDIGPPEDLSEPTSSDGSIDTDATESLSDKEVQSAVKSTRPVQQAPVADNAALREKGVPMRGNMVSISQSYAIRS